MSDASKQAHWEAVYHEKAPDTVSWHQASARLSPELIEKYLPVRNAAIVDVGGGASTLTDGLLDAGYSDISVLDIAEAGLARLRQRLAVRAEQVRWIVSDITNWRPSSRYALWHDRAVLHFLVDAEDQAAYAAALWGALEPSGVAIIAGFAPGGPEKCSGLSIVQHNATSLGSLLGNEFSLLEVRDEVHMTPWNTSQAFRYHVFRRT